MRIFFVESLVCGNLVEENTCSLADAFQHACLISIEQFLFKRRYRALVYCVCANDDASECLRRCCALRIKEL